MGVLPPPPVESGQAGLRMPSPVKVPICLPPTRIRAFGGGLSHNLDRKMSLKTKPKTGFLLYST